MYGNISFEDLMRNEYASSIRNKLIAEAFYLTGDIEGYGTGFMRIRKTLDDYSEIAMTFEEIGDFSESICELLNQLSPMSKGCFFI